MLVSVVFMGVGVAPPTATPERVDVDEAVEAFVDHTADTGLALTAVACTVVDDDADCYGRIDSPPTRVFAGVNDDVDGGGVWIVAEYQPPVPWTVAELDATIAPSANAWVSAPNGGAYDTLAAAVASILATGRPLPPELIDSGRPGATASAALTTLSAYPGGDQLVFEALNDLTLPSVAIAASPPAPAPAIQPAVDLPTAGDPIFDTCGAAIDAGYGPYVRGRDPEYGSYDDRDNDGTVCE